MRKSLIPISFSSTPHLPNYASNRVVIVPVCSLLLIFARIAGTLNLVPGPRIQAASLQLSFLLKMCEVFIEDSADSFLCRIDSFVDVVPDRQCQVGLSW